MSLRRPSMAHELPEELPPDENVLWQGAPAWWPVTRSLHIRPVAAYFALLLLWVTIDRLSHHAAALLPDLARFGALTVAGLGLFAAYGFLVARTTSYTLTTRRLILQAGIALPISFNFPYSQITDAAVSRHRDGSGNIAIRLQQGGARLSTVVLWPHVRGGKTGLQPMLRAVPAVDEVGRRLARLLAGVEDKNTGAAPGPSLGQRTAASAAPGRSYSGPEPGDSASAGSCMVQGQNPRPSFVS